MGALATLLPLLIQMVPTINTLVQTGLSAASIGTALKAEAPTLAPVLSQIGAQIFPKVAPEMQAVAVAMTSFDPNTTKWLQNALNQLVKPPPNLKVDGVYGPGTQAAVEAVQAQMGLTADGWAGHLTQTAIQAALNKLPEL